MAELNAALIAIAGVLAGGSFSTQSVLYRCR